MVAKLKTSSTAKLAPPKTIVIVGGGTAGWMAANLFAHQFSQWHTKIVLVESSKIPTVGVGEGSTPYLKEFFTTLAIPESAWMPECNATYKCGIRFPNWCTSESQPEYFHPFYSDIDGPFAQQFFAACNKRRAGEVQHTNPDHYFVTSALSDSLKAPVKHTGEVQLTYGYHFDAGLLAKFLKNHAIKLGVRHIDDTVKHAHVSGKGDIVILETQSRKPIRGDLFVDCTGFKGLLIKEALGEKLVSYQKHLFCDSAIAIQTFEHKGHFKPETVSQALSAGWMWRIPLSNRYGNGYVYSAKHLADEDAERELRATLNLKSGEGDALKIKWQPGRIQQHWKQNCVAVGLSQGFLEPLEAPMLFIIQRTIEGFMEHYINGGFSDQNQDKFNHEINTMVDGTRDYLQGHYKLNSRTDSQFWRDCRANKTVSETLQDILKSWRSTDNFDAVLNKHQSRLAYLKTSWYCLLAGHDYFPKQSNIKTKPDESILRELRHLVSDFQDHAQCIT